MTTITIFPERRKEHTTVFSAITKEREATGSTAGEALDKLTEQLSEEETGTIAIVQQFRPDRFFSAAQRERLNELSELRRATRQAAQNLTPAEQTELEQLVDEEVRAATERARAILHDLESSGK